MTEDTQTARIRELETQLAKSEELLTACVKMLVELVDESDRGPGWNKPALNALRNGEWFDSREKKIIKATCDFVAAKKGE